MKLKEFGYTGAKVTPLGFGAMRFSDDTDKSVKLVRHAIDAGINYVDTAPYYVDHKSEEIIGAALQDGYRQRVYLATKCPVDGVDGSALRCFLEQSLKRIDTEYIDFYHLWALNGPKYRQYVLPKGGYLEYALKAQQEGLIKNLSFSYHGTVEDLKQIIDDGHFATMLVQYNLLDRKNEKAIKMAKEKGMGVAIMGPVGGGRLSQPSPAIQSMIPRTVNTSVELALRFVLSNPNVTIALSGMENEKMVDDNIAFAKKSALSKDESRQAEAAADELKALADLYCTGCDYCMPCPHGVNIPANFRLMNFYRVYGLKDYAQKMYDQSPVEQRADRCIECGECLPKCPQEIEIIKQLKEIVQTFGND